MNDVISLLQEQNNYLMAKLEKANRKIGALEYDLRKCHQLMQQQPCHWEPVGLPESSARIWVLEGGPQ